MTEKENDQFIGKSTLALTDTRIVELTVKCCCDGGRWFPYSAKGKLKNTVHLRSKYAKGWYKKIVLGEEDHVRDAMEWAKNSGQNLVNDYFASAMGNMAHRYKDQDRCEEEESRRLRVDVLGGLSILAAESMNRYDSGEDAPHKVNYP